MRSLLARGLAAATLLALVADPAAAEKRHFTDPVDTPDGIDIVSVFVKYENRLKVVIDHQGWDEPSAAVITYWFDTRKKDPGPEYRLKIRANADGFDLRDVETWKSTGTEVDCERHDASADAFADAPIVVWMAGRCIDRPDRVRVATRVREITEDSTAVDWAPKWTFYGWVDRY